jgi:hypothetical protein
MLDKRPVIVAGLVDTKVDLLHGYPGLRCWDFGLLKPAIIHLLSFCGNVLAGTWRRQRRSLMAQHCWALGVFAAELTSSVGAVCQHEWLQRGTLAVYPNCIPKRLNEIRKLLILLCYFAGIVSSNLTAPAIFRPL